MSSVSRTRADEPCSRANLDVSMTWRVDGLGRTGFSQSTVVVVSGN